MRFLEELNRPRTVLVALGIIVVVNGFLFLFYRYSDTNSAPSGSAVPGAVRTPNSVEESATPQTNEADYLTKVEDIQNGSVQTIDSSNDKLLRYDTLTPDDTADLQTNYSTLGDYRDQIENLDPPEGYRDQYETFRGAIGDLYDATEIAYRLASDPVRGTREDFEEYERRVDEATTALRQSNEMLGQNFDTTEVLQLPTRPV